MSGRSIWDLEETAKEADLELTRSYAARKSADVSPVIKLHDDVMKGCQASQFTRPNKVQLQVLPHFLDSYNQHLVVCAPPRSGKTSSAVLGILDYFSKATTSRLSSAILLGPTHEVAEASYVCAQKLARFCNVSLYFVAKGKRFNKDEVFSKEIFVGTPDRILNIFRSSLIDMKKVRFLFIDEADCLGNPKKYFSDISLIHQKLCQPKCRVIVSTTSENKNIKEYMEKYAIPYQTIKVEEDMSGKFSTNQVYIVCNTADEKVVSLTYILRMQKFEGQVVVFCERKDVARDLGELLYEQSMTVVVLIGDLSPLQRKKALEEFKAKTFKVLITTRSFMSVLPVDSITKLIHYDQILNEKHELDTNIYKKRECLLSKTEKCLIVYFIEKMWEEYLFKNSEVINGKFFFNNVEIIASEKLDSCF